MMIENLWNTAKAILRGKFTTIISYLKKQEKSQVNNLTTYLKQLKKEQTQPKVNRMKKIINSRTEINELEIKKTIAEINKTESWFFKNIKLISL